MRPRWMKPRWQSLPEREFLPVLPAPDVSLDRPADNSTRIYRVVRVACPPERLPVGSRVFGNLLGFYTRQIGACGDPVPLTDGTTAVVVGVSRDVDPLADILIEVEDEIVRPVQEQQARKRAEWGVRSHMHVGAWILAPILILLATGEALGQSVTFRTVRYDVPDAPGEMVPRVQVIDNEETKARGNLSNCSRFFNYSSCRPVVGKESLGNV